jgi:hypothetical protein
VEGEYSCHEDRKQVENQREWKTERDSDRENTLKGSTKRENIRYGETDRKMLIKYIGALCVTCSGSPCF